MSDEYIDVYLPKWPALVIQGDNISVDQAAEILIKTDSNRFDFSFAGNDRNLRHKLSELFNCPKIPKTMNWQDSSVVRDEHRQSHGYVELSYLNNSRIVSSYIGGPHGWCNWDGTIGCDTYNIGKYPSGRDVYEDLRTLGTFFPFLHLKLWLFDDEPEDVDTERRALMYAVLKDGEVTALPVGDNPPMPRSVLENNVLSIVTGTRSEQGIPLAQLKAKYDKLYAQEEET
jgi:hypothetical protein